MYTKYRTKIFTVIDSWSNSEMIYLYELKYKVHIIRESSFKTPANGIRLCIKGK